MPHSVGLRSKLLPRKSHLAAPRKGMRFQAATAGPGGGGSGSDARITSTCRPRARCQALTPITAAEVLRGPRRRHERAAGQDRLAGGIAVLTGVRTKAGYQPPR